MGHHLQTSSVSVDFLSSNVVCIQPPVWSPRPCHFPRPFYLKSITDLMTSPYCLPHTASNILAGTTLTEKPLLPTPLPI